jgi:hypothetical protein
MMKGLEMDDQILKKLEQRVNRRSFLRGSGLVAAAALGVAAFPLGSAAQNQRDDKKTDGQKTDQEPEKKEDKPAEEDEFKITRKDERGRDYRTCPQCGFHMYKQDRTWTCENCGYSYTE